MKAVIISNGDLEDKNTLKSVAKEADYIICADGGLRHLRELKIKPHIVLGDLDSIDKDLMLRYEDLGVKFAKYPIKKDKTDTELAIDHALELGADEITLMGVIGTRIDHSLANIMLLYKLLTLGVKGRILNEHNEVLITDQELIIKKEVNTYISIIPIMGNPAYVTLKGFEYEIDDVEFFPSTTLGVSNRIIEKEGLVKVRNGSCLVIKSKD